MPEQRRRRPGRFTRRVKAALAPIRDLLPVRHGVALFAANAELAVVDVVAPMTGDAGVAHRRGVAALGRLALMAGFAGHLAVRTVELVVGALVVVVVPHRPGPRVVTRLAALTEPELVLVVLLVAAETIARRIAVARRQMAGLARHHQVPSGQRVTRSGVVESRDLPGRIAVALLAGLALLALVLVVLLVAAVAIERCVAITAQVLVAGIALQLGFGMCIAQLEFRPVVIEAALGGLPVTLDVAVTALVAQRSLMLVVLAMAADALLGRLFVDRALVAGLAFDLRVLTQQREARLVVVELDLLLPAAFAVAAAAVAPQRLFVFVMP